MVAIWIFSDQLLGDAWHLNHISLLNIIYKLIIFKPSNKLWIGFDTYPYVEANYMVTSGMFQKPNEYLFIC